jgi:lysophospholipase L1-like esterase
LAKSAGAAVTWQIIGLAVLAALAIGVGSYALAPKPAPAASFTMTTKIATPSPSPSPTIAPLVMHEGSRVLFFGDSWTRGTSAEPATKGFVYLAADALKLDATVDGVGGTGYLNKGPRSSGNFGDRLARIADIDPEIIVIQGSVNDMTQPAAALPGVIRSTIKAFKDRFPAAQLVVLGPAPNTAPGASPGIGTMDVMLANAAFDNGASFISPWRDQWITTENVSQVIDPATMYPSTAGHAVLAARLTASLRKLAG